MPAPANRRMPLSCEPCRERKIRCPRNGRDTKGPCETCIRRGIAPSDCIYLRDLQPRRYVVRAVPDSSPNLSEASAGASTSNSELLARIRNLEELLYRHGIDGGAPREAGGERSMSSSMFVSPTDSGSIARPSGGEVATPGLEQDGSAASSPCPTDTSSSWSRLSVSPSGHIRYEPLSSQWASVLGGSPVANAVGCAGFQDARQDADFPVLTNMPGLEDLLVILPPRSACDALTDVYFNVVAPLWHVLHDPTFLSDYARFLLEPRSVSLSWLALLFAVLGVAISALGEESDLLQDLGRHSSPAENSSLLMRRYRGAALQCLEADRYLWRHNMHTLQTLVLLIYGINHSHGQCWALLGLARHVAIAMGCHIDPDGLGAAARLDIVQAEERRRCWAALNMLYTIQNTALGNFDGAGGAGLQGSVKLPMDIDDNRLVRDRSDVMPDPIPASWAPSLGNNGTDNCSNYSLPSKMSYLLCKFRLYDVCSRICSLLFAPDENPITTTTTTTTTATTAPTSATATAATTNNYNNNNSDSNNNNNISASSPQPAPSCRCPAYGAVAALDAEIATLQDAWNFKYLVDTQGGAGPPLPVYHAVHLNVLFGYSHQLFLLLHRPVLLTAGREHHGPSCRCGYTPQQLAASRKRCLESARALLGIQRILHEDVAFRPYRWYNRGLGSFHAFHGAVIVAYLASTSTSTPGASGADGEELGTVESTGIAEGLWQDLSSAIGVFEGIAASGLSRVCQRAVPILRRLDVLGRRLPAGSRSGQDQAVEAQTGSMGNYYYAVPQQRAPSSQAGLANVGSSYILPETSPETLPTPYGPQLDAFLDTLQPQRWMSPSAMAWTGWDYVFYDGIVSPQFVAQAQDCEQSSLMEDATVARPVSLEPI